LVAGLCSRELSKRWRASSQGPVLLSEFVLAGIARTALIAGNEYRSTPVAESDIVEMARLQIEVHNPPLNPNRSLADLRPMMNRIAYEQFGFQVCPHQELGRVLPILGDSLDPGSGPSEDDWRRELGCTVEQFVRLGFSLEAISVRRDGRLSGSLLGSAALAEALAPMPVADAMKVIRGWLSMALDGYREEGLKWQRPGLEKWCFNPLVERPLVAVGDALVCPVPSLVSYRVSLRGLYFIGMQLWGSAFSDALGLRFEKYVKYQLELLQHATVYGEFVCGKPEKKTVDCIVVTEEAVVLVEVKISRPIEGLRLGECAGEEDAQRKLVQAYDQIEATKALLDDCVPELDCIPKDRGVFGLAVFLEPFHLAGTPFYKDLVGQRSLPIRPIAASDVESLASYCRRCQDIGKRLGKAIESEGHGGLSLAWEGLSAGKNPILRCAWRKLWQQIGHRAPSSSTSS